MFAFLGENFMTPNRGYFAINSEANKENAQRINVTIDGAGDILNQDILWNETGHKPRRVFFFENDQVPSA